MIMYNPGVQDIRGQLLGAGISQAAQSIAQGLDRWQKNEEQRQFSSGQIASALAQDPMSVAGVDPKLVDKFMGGKASLNETQQLLGAVTTSQQLKATKLQQALEQARLQALQQQTNQQAAQIQAGLAGRARVRALYGGQPAQDEIQAALAAGDTMQNLTPNPNPPQDAADALPKILAATGGQVPPELSAMIDRVGVVSQRENAAQLRARDAQQKLEDAKGNFGSLDDAAAALLKLEKMGVKGGRIIPKPGGTYDIGTNPPVQYAPDLTEKVQSALDLANEDLADARQRGDALGAQNAQSRINTYTARLKYLTQPKGNGIGDLINAFNGSSGSGGMPMAPGAGAPTVVVPSTQQPGGAAMARPRSKAERDALPDGTPYIGPDGNVYVKRSTR